jgi:glycine cleavage system H protein
MSSNFEVPEELRYLDSHEWVDGTTGHIGITDFAQDELGDVVFVDLPSEGEDVDAGEDFGVVESIKAVSDVYSPVSGTVTAVNDALEDQPELLNEDPYGDGWLIEVELDDESEFDELIDAGGYADQIA